MSGTIYGGNPYTNDSHMPTAAVHAGLIPSGMTTIIEPENIVESLFNNEILQNNISSSLRDGLKCGYMIKIFSRPFGQFIIAPSSTASTTTTASSTTMERTTTTLKHATTTEFTPTALTSSTDAITISSTTSSGKLRKRWIRNALHSGVSDISLVDSSIVMTVLDVTTYNIIIDAIALDKFLVYINGTLVFPKRIVTKPAPTDASTTVLGPLKITISISSIIKFSYLIAYEVIIIIEFTVTPTRYVQQSHQMVVS